VPGLQGVQSPPRVVAFRGWKAVPGVHGAVRKVMSAFSAVRAVSLKVTTTSLFWSASSKTKNTARAAPKSTRTNGLSSAARKLPLIAVAEMCKGGRSSICAPSKLATVASRPKPLIGPSPGVTSCPSLSYCARGNVRDAYVHARAPHTYHVDKHVEVLPKRHGRGGVGVQQAAN
jgi:hypothetical protein